MANIVTYPYKSVQPPLSIGMTVYDPTWASYGYNYTLTDGTGACYWNATDGTQEHWNTYSDNTIGYMVSKGWGVHLAPTLYMMEQYPTNPTPMNLFKTSVITNFIDLYSIPWYLEISDAMGNDYAEFNYRTPAYNESWYTPAGAQQPSYDAAIGEALAFILNNCSNNLMGISFESIYANATTWLTEAAPGWTLQQKYWNTGFGDWDPSSVCVLNGTNQVTGADLSTNSASVTPTQTMNHLANISEIVMEVFTIPQFDPWVNGLPTILAEYPDIHVIMNCDATAAYSDFNFNTYTEIESGTDNGWWATTGAGQPTNRCQTERLGFLEAANRLREETINGVFDGVIWNPYNAGGHGYFPYSNASGYPTDTSQPITWNLEWLDANSWLWNKAQTPEIGVVIA